MTKQKSKKTSKKYPCTFYYSVIYSFYLFHVTHIALETFYRNCKIKCEPYFNKGHTANSCITRSVSEKDNTDICI